MQSHRKHNFSAGPAVLPLSVIEELREALPDLHGSGIGLMEISHRSKTFDAVIRSAIARARRVLALPDDHTVLLLQGGASLQFLMLAQSLLRGGVADYIDTGTWASNAIAEARRFGTVNVPYSGRADKYRALPRSWDSTPGAVYTHYTSNNTIYGTQFQEIPRAEGLLICDASSDIASRPIDGARFDMLYAGAQKNLGPSGVVLVALSPRAMERADRDAPTMLNYHVHAAKDSLYNTPNTLGIFVLERVLAWIEARGLDTIAADNARKAGMLYGLLDSSGFWRPHAARDSRSLMNVTWRLTDPDLEPVMVAEATAAGLDGIKGHRSVGGLRASIYNACPVESVEALVDFLKDFERRRG